MAEITASQLVIAKTGALWSIAPRTDRDYTSPIEVESLRTVYGSYAQSLDFVGKFGTAQRFQATVRITNARGVDGMNGLIQTMVDEVDLLTRFRFRWPQELGTESADSWTVSANAAAGATTVRMRGSATKGAPRVGRLIQFETNGKLHRVATAPAGNPSTAYAITIFPALTKAVTAATTVNKDSTSLCRFTAKPALITSEAIMLRATLVVREALS